LSKPFGALKRGGEKQKRNWDSGSVRHYSLREEVKFSCFEGSQAVPTFPSGRKWTSL
jgi:hypothetical protein